MKIERKQCLGFRQFLHRGNESSFKANSTLEYVLPNKILFSFLFCHKPCRCMQGESVATSIREHSPDGGTSADGMKFIKGQVGNACVKNSIFLLQQQHSIRSQSAVGIKADLKRRESLYLCWPK